MSTSTATSPFSDEELKHVAKAKILHKMAFRIHLAAYICVNLALVAINYLTSFFSPIWFVYPVAGWFIGIVVHGTVYALYVGGTSGAGRVGLVVHAAAYLASAPALAVINYFSSPGYPWCLWPVGFWLVGVVIHGMAYKAAASKASGGAQKKSWLDQGVDKEMTKIKAKRQG
ncbi:MAG: 2TM domain-containing protein [Candidatus Lokiarchaeota archaeon]|nr:2TM domain-containing protein [Candidatus Lokiarchaeota archaeon]